MLYYIFRRVFYAVPIALSVSVVCFMLVHIAPGDPIDAILPPDATKEIVDLVRKDYGLDQPLPMQYGLWLTHVVQGDLGRSISNRRPVLQELVSASGKTFILAMTAATLGFLVGTALGCTAAFYHGTWVDRMCVAIAVAGVSIPHYWLGMVLVVVFSVLLSWLPAMGAGPGDAWAWDWIHVRHLILPAITLSVIPAGLVTRTMRGVIVEILNEEYITALKAKGLHRSRIFWHVLKNAAPTAIAVMGLQFGYLMGGSILIETVFSWPGTGMLLNGAIFRRDIPVIQGTTLALSLFFVLLNLMVDLVQVSLDPRMRRA